ncbi:MAG TPA: DUF47 domain-containing protein [bacterium]|jgi:hypothetical protein|nr:DUF47 domain-containing protein [Dictyoglomota bacterium]HHV81614.1 DUF47 domain-containing protein [bacterium]HOK29441.1 DUF47 domain-containing protein [bacterium]HOL55606.1 DUF47 domain-containing protein [bacterium]HOP55770.1 DUF47 domain-containing protein [bacterium]
MEEKLNQEGKMEEKSNQEVKAEEKPIDKFSQMVGSAAQKLGEGLSQIAQRLGKETSKMARIAGLKADIFRLQNDKRSKLEELGNKVLSLYKEDKLSADNLEALKDNINSILEIEKEIDLKNSEIKKIQEEEKMTDEEVSQIPMG